MNTRFSSIPAARYLVAALALSLAGIAALALPESLWDDALEKADWIMDKIEFLANCKDSKDVAEALGHMFRRMRGR